MICFIASLALFTANFDMSRLTATTFNSAFNATGSITKETLIQLGSTYGFSRRAMIFIIGTTQNEGYIQEPYLNYEWACALLNYTLENNRPDFFTDMDSTYAIIARPFPDGWGAEYNEARITSLYNGASGDTLKEVYLALTRRDRNTFALSGGYYDSSVYAYYTSSIYPEISVWYFTGRPIIDDGDAPSFTIRTSSPRGSFLPYYMTNLYGASWDLAYNTCIYGSPTSNGANVLANCTGYAQGRALEVYCEVTNYRPSTTRTHPFVGLNGDAGTWFPLAPSLNLQTSQVAQVGSIACWSQTGDAGHVAFVERIEGNTAYLSQSGYGGFGGSDWGTGQIPITGGNDSWMNSTYHFQGFILNPAHFSPTPPTPPTPTDGKKLKWIYWMRHPYRNRIF